VREFMVNIDEQAFLKKVQTSLKHNLWSTT